MALQQWLAYVHSGAGTGEHKQEVNLPGNLYVAFYVPPGRQLGKDLARHVFNDLYPSLKMTSLAEIDQYHKNLRGQIRTTPRTGNTPASALELHSALTFTNWPRIVGQGYADTKYLLNYHITGPTGKDARMDAKVMGIRHLGSGPLMRFQNETDATCMKDILELMSKCSEGDQAILHFLGCREESVSASEFGSLFSEEPATGSRQQIKLI